MHYSVTGHALSNALLDNRSETDRCTIDELSGVSKRQKKGKRLARSVVMSEEDAVGNQVEGEQRAD